MGAGLRSDAEARQAAVPLGYEPALDGLRAVAVTCVFLAHVGIRPFIGGSFGVDIFFVLSGFLITSLLVEERTSTGTISLRAFYTRRVLRLLPASILLSLVFAVFVDWRASLAVVLYVANWCNAFRWHDMGGLGHCWSLSIEEQFYFVWPMLLLVLHKLDRRRTNVAVLALVALSIGWRSWLAFHGASADRIYNGFDTRADALLVGCLIGLNRDRLDQAPALRRVSVAFVAFALACIPFAYALLQSYRRSATSERYFLMAPTPIESSVMYTVLAVGSAVILIIVRRGTLTFLNRILTHPIFLWVGRRSYGIYLWHYPVILLWVRSPIGKQLVARLHLRSGLVLLLCMVTTLAVAATSYALVELPFLKLKRRFERRQTA